MNPISKSFIAAVALLVMATLACLSTGGGGKSTGTSIGTVSLVDDKVEHNNNPLSGTENLKGNDSIKVTDAGEGLLDFGGDLLLRMFNTTSLGGITVASSSGSPLDVRMTLESGGFTGNKVKPGGKAVFDTPNGAKITIYGTDFFIVYDQLGGVTTAGNFSGQMEIEAGFEQRSRELASPVDALGTVDIIPPEPIPVDTTPPLIQLVSLDPQPIAIGPECPGAPGTTQITVQVFDDSGADRVHAFWSINQESGELMLDRIDEITFTATIGPVKSTGSLVIELTAWDNAGNEARSTPIFVDVILCIG